jgi:hypothetical protein
MAETSVIALIGDTLAEILSDAVQSDLTAKAADWYVKIGPLQENPQSAGVNITVQPNDPDEPGKWRHSIVSRWPEGNPMAAFRQLPGGMHELGGGLGFNRRFTVELQIFLGRAAVEDESENLQLAGLVFSACEYALLTDGRLGPSIGPDSFGEKVMRCDNNVIAYSELTGGGLSGIYRGKIWLEIKTYRDVARQRV